MGEDFFEGFLSKPQIHPKEEKAESIPKKTDEEAKKDYGQYLRDQAYYEDAREKKHQKERQIKMLKEEIQTALEKFKDLQRRKDGLEKDYMRTKEKAPQAAQKQWDQMMQENMESIEAQKQKAIKAAEEEKRSREIPPDFDNIFSDKFGSYGTDNKIQNLKREILGLHNRIQNLREEILGLQNGEIEYTAPFNKRDCRREVRGPKFLVGILVFFLLISLNIGGLVKVNNWVGVRVPDIPTLLMGCLVTGLCAYCVYGYWLKIVGLFYRNSSKADTDTVKLIALFLAFLCSWNVKRWIYMLFVSILWELYFVFLACGAAMATNELIFKRNYIRKVNEQGRIAQIYNLQNGLQQAEIEKDRLEQEKEVQEQRLKKCQQEKQQQREEKKRKYQEDLREVTKANEETERRLEETLREIEKQRIQTPMPDFSREENFLKKDRKQLNKLLWEIQETETDMEKFSETYELYKQRLQSAEDVYKDIQHKLDYYSHALREYLSDKNESFPALGEETILFSDQICIRNYVDPEHGYPQIIKHSMKPLVFQYASRAEWQEDGAVNLLSEVWKGYTKMVPAELLDFSVVDPDGLVKGKLGNKSDRRVKFFRAYRSGFSVQETEVVNRVRGLFKEEEIRRLDQEIEKEQVDIEEYNRENEEAVDKAEQKYRETIGKPGELTPIQQANLTLLEGRAVKKPYHIVMIIVPNEAGKRGESEWRFRQMGNLVEKGNSGAFGFLPVFLVSGKEDEIGDSWKMLIEKAMSNGIVYQVNL